MEFTVLSYNILSDDLTNPDFIMIEPKYLNNSKRSKLLLKQLKSRINNTTIFCFQEVSGSQLSVLAKFFFDYRFYYVGIGDLAIFFSFETFTLLGANGNAFPSLVGKTKSNVGELYQDFNDSQRKTLALRKKYFLGVHLKFNTTKQAFTIVTTHLISNPNLDNLKILQTVALMKVFSKGPMILCGDFNSTPQSAQMISIVKGKIDNPIIKTSMRSLTTVYKRGITTHASNKTTPLFSERIDHIFYSQEFSLKKAVPILSKSTATIMPNKQDPSDHCIIGATFVLNK